MIGASAGGIEALSDVLAHVPLKLPAPLLMVLHVDDPPVFVVPDVLSRAGAVKVTAARNGERLLPAHAYLAPPDCHMLVRDGEVLLSAGAREKHFRPAIDPLFRSAARVYGAGAVGVLLSGMLDDGTAGLTAIRAVGGVVIVQSPGDARYPQMPSSALANVHPDHVVRAADIGPLLDRVLRSRPVSDPNAAHVDAVSNGEDGPETALELTEALSSAIHILEDRLRNLDRLAKKVRAKGLELAAANYEEGARDDRRRLAALRRALHRTLTDA